MNRRSAIKNTLLIATGFAILPRHLRSEQGPSIQLAHLEVSATQEALLAEVVDTLIPATDTPGAKALKVHLFVLKMLDDCHDLADQDLFIAGLGQLEAYAWGQTGKNFTACSREERELLLTKLMQKNAVSPELWAFNRLVRSRTIEGYRESEYVMTHILPHHMIPPPYDGNYPASNYEEAR